MTEQKFTPEEMEEAMRRIFHSGGLENDEQINEALKLGVEAGFLEYSEEKDAYRLTEKGNEFAENNISQVLDAPAPCAEADTHLYTHLVNLVEDKEELDFLFSFGKDVIRLEHRRLGVRLQQFSDEWAGQLAEVLIEGRL